MAVRQRNTAPYILFFKEYWKPEMGLIHSFTGSKKSQSTLIKAKKEINKQKEANTIQKKPKKENILKCIEICMPVW